MKQSAIHWTCDDVEWKKATVKMERPAHVSDFGFFSNKKKWWIIAKPDKTESVKEVFKETDIT